MVFCCLKWDPQICGRYLSMLHSQIFFFAVDEKITPHKNVVPISPLEAATAVWAPISLLLMSSHVEFVLYSAHLVHEDTHCIFTKSCTSCWVYPITILLFTGLHSYEWIFSIHRRSPYSNPSFRKIPSSVSERYHETIMKPTWFCLVYGLHACKAWARNGFATGCPKQSKTRQN